MQKRLVIDVDACRRPKACKQFYAIISEEHHRKVLEIAAKTSRTKVDVVARLLDYALHAVKVES